MYSLTFLQLCDFVPVPLFLTPQDVDHKRSPAHGW